MVAQLQADYANWWDGVKDQLNLPERIVIGDDAENPTLLTCCEWFDVIVDQQRQVRAGDPRNGVWHVDIATAGDYRFELRRWPRAADLPLQAAAPAAEATDGLLPAGQALPIAAARIRIGEQTRETEISTDDPAAVFEISLPAEPCEIETAFLDGAGRELCGAYYLHVTRQ